MEDAGLGIKGAAALKNTSVQQPLFHLNRPPEIIISRTKASPEDAYILLINMQIRVDIFVCIW